MRTLFKYIAFCVAASLTVACGDLYDMHGKYLKMGEETYVGRADSLQANGGLNRVELKWKLNVDPKISKCVITWNGCLQPVEVPVERPGSSISKIIDIAEGKYIFKITVKSDSGKESLAQTVSGESFGLQYQSRLPQRGISSLVAAPTGATIEWLPEEGCVGVNLSYTNNTGVRKTVFVEGSETSTLIADFVPGSDFTMSSVFKPEKNAIDEIASLPRTMTFPAYYVISKVDWDQTYHQNYTDVPVTGWTLEATTEERGGEGSVSGYVTALLDGDLSTYWHSAWKNGIDGVINPPLPHLITIDMQVQQDIISVELARRPNNKDTKTVVFSISSDKENWRELGALYFPNATAPNALILLLPDNVNGRYIRASVTESNNVPNASISEMMFTSKK